MDLKGRKLIVKNPGLYFKYAVASDMVPASTYWYRVKYANPNYLTVDGFAQKPAGLIVHAEHDVALPTSWVTDALNKGDLRVE